MIKFCVLLLIVVQFLVAPPASASLPSAPPAEEQLHNIFYALSHYQSSTALKKIDAMLADYPNFGLLHLLRAETLSILAHQPTLMTTTTAMQKRRIGGLWHEAETRLAYRPPPPQQLPEAVLLLSDRHKHVLIFSASQARLFLFSNDNGAPRYQQSFYASVGYAGLGKSRRGDNKTPLGIYHIVTRLDEKKLPSLYGDGAYPINYPNAWDKRHGRQGSGIWLHGVVPDMHSRPPRDSRGCIVVSNAALRQLRAYIAPGSTPILILAEMTWLPATLWQQRQKSMLGVFLQWQKDWESLNLDNYLSHYSPNYATEKHSYQTMVEQTRNNAKAKTFVRVDTDTIDVFQYPGEIDTALFIFNQNYQSNNYNIRYRKQQFWKKESAWKIVYEGRAESVQPRF